MKKILILTGFYLMTPFIALADFIDLLPKKQSISGNLPQGDLATHFLPRFIDIMIKSAYTISVGFMIYAALLYFIAHGEEGEAKKAKKILIYGAIGFVIITISYAIVEGVTKITWNL
jgi:hypothetical protein